ncbi:MAG: hypothetical protein CL607_28945 [Anaerolineaceae bacterium]|nr:hypothetical protein [Anaerolineaceae bacterium]
MWLIWLRQASGEAVISVLEYNILKCENEELKRLEILERTREKDLHIDDFIEISISSRKNHRDRRIEELL